MKNNSHCKQSINLHSNLVPVNAIHLGCGMWLYYTVHILSYAAGVTANRNIGLAHLSITKLCIKTTT